MKILLMSALFVVSTSSAFASETLSCEVRTTVDSADAIVQNVELKKVDDPHGSLTVFKLEQFGGITGLIGLMNNDIVVISLADTAGYASSSHSNVAQGAIAHHQLILPSPGVGVNAIVVDCQYID